MRRDIVNVEVVKGCMFVLFMALFTMICAAGYGAGDIYDVTDFGAAGDGQTNDADPIREALQAGIGSTVVFPPGTYLIEEDITLEVGNDIKLQGTPDEAVLLFGGNHSLIFRSASVGGRRMLVSDNQRGDAILRLDDISDIESGDVVAVAEPTVAETGWNRPARHLSRVTAVDGENSSVTIAHPLNFNFSPNADATVSISRPQGQLTMEGFDVRVRDEQRSLRCMIKFRGLRGARAENIRFLGVRNFGHRGLLMSGCLDTTFRNIHFNQIQYGFLINNSRNSVFERIESYNSRHPVTPANWSDGIYVDGLSGNNNQGIMDAHPSFNIHYNNVVSGIEAAPSNLRSVGGSVRNSRFTYLGDMPSGPYFQQVALVNPEIFDDHIFEMENVVWVAPSPILVRQVGTAILRNVQCFDLEGNEVGVAVGAGVGRVIMEDTMPEKALQSGYNYMPANLWSSVGPFRSEHDHSHEALKAVFDHRYTPEEDYIAGKIDLEDEYPGGVAGKELSWKHSECTEGFLMKEGLNFGIRHNFDSSQVSYAITFIHSPENRETEVFIGCDFWAKGWINGEELQSNRPAHLVEADGAAFKTESREKALVDLQKGWNSLLIKVQGGGGGSSFTAVIEDPGDLRFSPFPSKR